MIKIFFALIFLLVVFVVVKANNPLLRINNYKKNVKHTTIYTKQNCIYCIEAKKLLYDQNIIFNDIDLTFNKELHIQLIEETSQRTVPYIFINVNFICGYQDLLELVNANKLEPILKALN